MRRFGHPERLKYPLQDPPLDFHQVVVRHPKDSNLVLAQLLGEHTVVRVNVAGNAMQSGDRNSDSPGQIIQRQD